jgi:hypothetical protein
MSATALERSQKGMSEIMRTSAQTASVVMYCIFAMDEIARTKTYYITN